MRLHTAVFLSFLLGCIYSCSAPSGRYAMLGNIEDPQNQIIRTMVKVLNQNLEDSISLVPGGIGSISNLDSLKKGAADLAIVDNYAPFSDDIRSIMPLYAQILHIMYRGDTPHSISELLTGKKVFSGSAGSGAHMFVRQLMKDYGVKTRDVEFVGYLDFFKADVIFVFTDLLSHQELRDLMGYKLFSIDKVENMGRGSLAEGICTRYPQFKPYILPRDVYGSFADGPVLTVAVDAVLVGRADLPNDFIYNIMQEFQEHKQTFVAINPLLFEFSKDFNAEGLNFTVHEGARSYLQRYEPTFLEKYAEVLSVIISIFVALGSMLYTLAQWNKTKKKNKIDIYYKKLLILRNRVSQVTSREEADEIAQKIRNIQQETMGLVIGEKLFADESFSIFLDLSRIVAEEVKVKSEGLLV